MHPDPTSSSVQATPRDAAGGDVRHELRLLSARLARACHDNRVLRAQVVRTCEQSAVVRLVIERRRAMWAAWHDALATWRASGPQARRVLRVCKGCDAVCFTPPARTTDTAPNDELRLGESDVWVEPPSLIREWMRNGWMESVRSHGVCARCAPGVIAGLADDAAVTAPAPSASRRVLDAIARVENAASTLVARMPWLTLDEAVDEAYRAALARLADTATPDDLRDLSDLLNALTRQLRGTPSHFRPCLRRRR